MKQNMKEGDEIVNLEPFSDKNVKRDDEEGIQGPGTYVMKDGKLVKGEGRKKEEVMFSNWYCSNADPEDLRRHRELMDRFCYKGPKWEGVGVPKSIVEEENPLYRKSEEENHPSKLDNADELWGDKDFEYIVR